MYTLDPDQRVTWFTNLIQLCIHRDPDRLSSFETLLHGQNSSTFKPFLMISAISETARDRSRVNNWIS